MLSYMRSPRVSQSKTRPTNSNANNNNNNNNNPNDIDPYRSLPHPPGRHPSMGDIEAPSSSSNHVGVAGVLFTASSPSSSASRSQPLRISEWNSDYSTCTGPSTDTDMAQTTMTPVYQPATGKLSFGTKQRSHSLNSADDQRMVHKARDLYTRIHHNPSDGDTPVPAPRSAFPVDADTGEAWDRIPSPSPPIQQSSSSQSHTKQSRKRAGKSSSCFIAADTQSYATSAALESHNNKNKGPFQAWLQQCYAFVLPSSSQSVNDVKSDANVIATEEEDEEHIPHRGDDDDDESDGGDFFDGNMSLTSSAANTNPHLKDKGDAASVNNMSLSSEQTRKVSNVDPKLALKIQQRKINMIYNRKQQQKAEQKRKNRQKWDDAWKRLTTTRNGRIVLALLIILLVSLFTTIFAAVASGNKKKRDEELLNTIDFDDDDNIGTLPTAPTTSPTEYVATQSPTQLTTQAPTVLPVARPPPTLPPTAGSTASIMETVPNPTLGPTVKPPTAAPTGTPPTATTFLGTSIQEYGTPLAGTGNDEQFGHSVVLSANGQVMAVGAPYATVRVKDPDADEDENDDEYFDEKYQAGRVQVYEQGNGGWALRGEVLLGRTSRDLFGYAMALSQDGNLLVVGEPNYRGKAGLQSGLVRTFVYGPTNRYEPLGEDLQGAKATDKFGSSLSLSADGTRLAVGSPYHDITPASQSSSETTIRTVAGKVSVYELVSDGGSGNKWVSLGPDLKGAEHMDRFGWSTAMSDDGSILCAGAPSNVLHGGYVNCYSFLSNSWLPMGTQILNSMSPVSSDDHFGMALRLSTMSGTNRLAIGSPGKGGGSVDVGMAAVYEFVSGANAWQVIGAPIMGASGLSTSSIPTVELGFAVDLAGDILVVGSPGKMDQGEVTLYQLTTNLDGTVTWSGHPDILVGEAGSNFGSTVRLAQSTLAVGSPVTSGVNTGRVHVYTVAV